MDLEIKGEVEAVEALAEVETRLSINFMRSQAAKCWYRFEQN